MNHSFIAPSSASVWVKCNAYPMMSATYPSEDTEATLEGSASHELGEALITMGTAIGMDKITDSVRDELVGNLDSSGKTVYSDEMFDAAWVYADDVVREYHRRDPLYATIQAEYRVHAPTIHAESFGTTDCYLYDSHMNDLIIWDYKYGMGVVEAFENWQGINYYAGLMDELQLDDQNLTVRIRIAQPRAFHRDGQIREWVIRGTDLRAYVTQLHNGAQRCIDSTPTATTGSHCKYCEARHACEPALEAGISLFEVSRETMPLDIGVGALSVQLAIVKRASEQLKFLQSAYETQITSMIKSGKSVPGWSLQPKFGRLKWDKSVSDVTAMGDMMGIDLRDPKVITPTKARAMGLNQAMLDAYSIKPSNGSELTPTDTKKSREVFSK